MKDIDIDALERILVTFENHVFQQERLLKEFRGILGDVRNAKKKRGYQRNPEYYKAKVQAWKKQIRKKKRNISGNIRKRKRPNAFQAFGICLGRKKQFQKYQPC